MPDVTVLKLGGALLADEAAVAAIWSTVADLDRVVVVHGGGPQATALAGRLGLWTQKWFANY